MRYPSHRFRLLLGALPPVLLLAACQVAPPASGRSSAAVPPPLVYVALGASETAGVGTRDPARESFPQQLYARLGEGAVLYDLGIPGETAGAALNDELPAALAAHPGLVTAFFGTDDLVAGVPAAAFQANLDRIVGGLARPGVRVLVANLPPLDRLPAFDACRSGAPSCPLHGAAVPAPAVVAAREAAYDQAVAEVVAAHRATLVDLAAAGAAAQRHPEYISPDGFHPSELGAAALAATFYDALSRGRTG